MSSTRLRTTAPDREPSRALAEEVRRVLEEGLLVGLPTETVYGIAARADRPEALERLSRLKGRTPDQAFTWHVASHAVLEHFRELPHTARRLAQRYWPGPLTLVLRGSAPGLEGIARAGWIGMRLPAHEAVRSLIAACPFPIVMSSANPTGAAPCVEAGAVLETFGEELALVVDGGRSRIGESSSVLRLGVGAFELLREGWVTAKDLRRHSGLSLGFVCTGNTCRSPLAEALARELLAMRLGTRPGDIESFGFQVSSAGVFSQIGSPAATFSVTIAGERGVDLSQHRSRPASEDWLADKDRLYCMTRSHCEALQLALTDGATAPVELLDPEGADVPDPIGGTIEDYRDCAARIRAALERRVDEWV